MKINKSAENFVRELRKPIMYLFDLSLQTGVTSDSLKINTILFKTGYPEKLATIDQYMSSLFFKTVRTSIVQLCL